MIMKEQFEWTHMRTTKFKKIFVHDMVHDNPGLVKYESAYNDPKFLKERGYDGKSFDLFNCAQYGLLWDKLTEKYGRKSVFPEGSEARAWVISRREVLKQLYQAVDNEGLAVSFMMDMIVLPKALIEIYPEVLNENGEIDIALPIVKQIIEEMFDEMFSVFPEIKGIYIRYGETYAGEKFGEPYHTGNNPILGGEEYHYLLISYLQEFVCQKHQREIYYRTWGFGDFQHNKETYLRVSDNIPVNDRFYFCIKHTTGDFHRCMVFNQSLNCGKHNQIVEVQAAREYEGKGAYPNYIADGVINGFEEYKWLMPDNRQRSLRDIVDVDDSKIKGIWIWSRGGGWDGPYINGRNGKNGEVVIENGSELWCDLNAYVISHWAKDPSKTDKYYTLQYAKEILGMSDKDSGTFYKICLLSSKAVLLGRACNTDKIQWSVWWTRDQNIRLESIDLNVKRANNSETQKEILEKQAESVKIWKEIISLADSLTTGDRNEFICVTARYGYYLYSLYEKIYRVRILYAQGKSVKEEIAEYDLLWEDWQKLKKNNPCCPTLYAKEDENQLLIGYDGNRGFDSAINPFR